MDIDDHYNGTADYNNYTNNNGGVGHTSQAHGEPVAIAAAAAADHQQHHHYRHNEQEEDHPEEDMMEDDDDDDDDDDDNDDGDDDHYHHNDSNNNSNNNNNNNDDAFHHEQQEHQQQQQQQHPSHPLDRPPGETRPSRRRSSTGAGSTTNSVSSMVGNGHMTESEQEERRRQIRTIMLNRDLSQQEKSRSIQSLMDGRQRRCSINSTGGHSYVSVGTTQSTAHSYVSNMSRVAAAASEYYNNNNNMPLCGGAAAAVVVANAASPGLAIASPHQLHHHHQQPILDMHQYRDDRSVASSVSSGSAGYDDDGGGGHHHSEDNDDGSGNQPVGHTNGGTTTSGGGSVRMTRRLPPSHVPYRQYHGRSQSLQDWTDTDRLAAAPNTTVLTNPAGVSRLMEQSRPECPHYVRNCTIIAPCCGLAFGCRICHDDCPVLPPPLVLHHHQHQAPPQYPGGGGSRRGSLGSTQTATIPAPHHVCKVVERRRSMPGDLQHENFEHEETHHLIDRFAIKEVICRVCYLRQSSKTNNCIGCGVQFGEYHCTVCNLWMTGKDEPYHCADCGFCRVGGADNFRHCHDCGMCIDINLFDDHNCKSGKYMSNCPVCQEDLFSSRFASHEMPCGHAIHWHCFQELISYDTRCPVCKKTAESPEDMAATWSTLAVGIACQPVPPDLARVVNIICIDCEQTSSNRRWHFLGVRCNNCLSFNTSVEQIVLQGRAAAEYLENRERNATVPTDITMLSILHGGGGSGGGADHNNNDDSMDEDDSSNEDDL